MNTVSSMAAINEKGYAARNNCPPPGKIDSPLCLSAIIVLNICTAALASSFATASIAAVINNDSFDWSKGYPNLSLSEETVVEGINVDVSTVVSWNNYTITTSNNLTVEGDTILHLYGTHAVGSGDSTQALHSGTNGVVIRLNGNVDLVTRYALGIEDDYGANVLYVNNGAKAILGNSGSTTRIWSIAASPDALSSKKGSTIEFLSTRNQVVGTMDMTVNGGSAEADVSTIKGTFSGYDSYWFGDEASSENTSAEGRKNSKGILDLTFTNGAQWSYLAVAGSKTIDKRISAITLRDGGIINLFDDNLEAYWDEIGLLPLLKNGNYDVDHNYVRIGDLKGNDGIFRLDLNSDDRTQSDMVFIESSSEHGRHWIEPYRPSQLVSVSADNTLTFALTQEAANEVTFADKINIYGETLYDYELSIDSDVLDADEKIAALEEEIVSRYEGFDPNDYRNGTRWFINRVTVSESAATVGVRNAGWAAYDAVMQMDRRDRRLREKVFVNEESNDGLWLRVQHGRLGADDAYKSDTTTIHLGYERQTSDNNRFGMSISYMDGEPDFENMKGSSELERYEIAVYDTLTLGNHYLDFVGRFGHLSEDFSASNANGTVSTQGDFSMNYGGISAEYGFTLKSVLGFFVEPQLQVQATRIEGYSYALQRGMSVEAQQDTTIVARAGLRLGKHFAGEGSSGEVYVRADVLHQFTDGQFGRIRDTQNTHRLHWGDAGTWANFGLGGYYWLADKFALQLDLEKSAGGETLDAWMVSGQLTYMF